MSTLLKIEPELVVFKPEHLDQIEIREYEAKLINKALMKILGVQSLYYTLMVGSVVIAIGGYYEMWPGRYEVAMVPSIHVPKYAKTVIKLIRNHHTNFMYDSGAKRLMTASRADPKTDKWMKALLFECEGVMKNYTQFGDDYKIWARLA